MRWNTQQLKKELQRIDQMILATRQILNWQQKEFNYAELEIYRRNYLANLYEYRQLLQHELKQSYTKQITTCAKLLKACQVPFSVQDNTIYITS